jgi:hypothetical protein
MDAKEIVWEVVGWIHVVQDWENRWVAVHTAQDLQVP